MASPSSSAAKQTGISDQVAGGIAYIMVLPAIYFLVSNRYNTRPYVRFHSWQAIYFFFASLIITVLLGALSNVVPALRFLNFEHFPLDSLLIVVLWVVVLIKAFNGEWYKLPIIGAMAQRRSRR